ncbi:YdaS family helix-turn-helix protein [Fulvimonas sp. R45]|uniref:YdaS family helix-turn-helix protein n=1 Tax=Fulvimonas sp. R45 TaxID=3045937 RepID=UPI00265E60F1|nr:YdaS family helix-turn-helix protein [Fulvimonas sp. R45]MDO1529285.1 YdaS family helix-turn-helix protein [Fulvimonas sp. R45]
MPTLAATPEVNPSRHAAGNGKTADFMHGKVHARPSFLEHPPRRPGAAHGRYTDDVRMAPSQAPAGAAPGLAARIRLLIQAEGSASALARRCGVSEGAVRNWRDGHTDMSRERCVVIAQALGISLLWLVSGEGAMRTEPPATDVAISPAHTVGTEAASLPHAPAVDSRLLASSLRLLQSYIGLAGGSLDPPRRADVLVELYGLLARAGEPGHAERLVAFHTTLGDLLRGHHRALIA